MNRDPLNTETSPDQERIRAVRERIARGYYDDPGVRLELARLILESGALDADPSAFWSSASAQASPDLKMRKISGER